MRISTRTQAWIRKKGLAGIVATTVFLAIPGVGLAQEDMVIKNGGQEYQAYCAIWGAHFLSEEGGGYLDEDRVIGRILGLTYYLQSIQKK